MPKVKQVPNDDYILVVRKKPKNPTWLSEHQKNMKEAARIAAQRTEHLKGEARLRAMNAITAEEIKKHTKRAL